MKRELPVISIEGTDFIVDVSQLELREKENPDNVILFEQMRDVGDGYTFKYSRDQPFFFMKGGITVKIPEWVELDPVGMAEKYGFTLEDLKGKTDFEVMVDQEALDMRINGGVLPTVEIAGHIFYVDIRMDMLRPKDDFSSKGIVFSEIDEYYLEKTDEYLIPYNPATHEFQELDWGKITEYPKYLIAVKFPCEWKLDPVGWNRRSGMDLYDSLKVKGVQSHVDAETIPWEKTVLRDIIRDNLRLQKKQTEEKEIPPGPDVEQGTKKGRKM